MGWVIVIQRYLDRIAECMGCVHIKTAIRYFMLEDLPISKRAELLSIYKQELNHI